MSVEDRLAILDVVGRYAFAFDDRNADVYAACFTADAVLDVWFAGWDHPMQSIVGVDAIRRWAAALFASLPPGMAARQIPIATHFDELDSSAARTRSFLVSTAHRPAEQLPFVPTTGVYRDVWSRQDGQWLLAHRGIHHDRTDPARPY